MRQIAELAVQRRLPSIYGQSEYAEAGGLMVYNPNLVFQDLVAQGGANMRLLRLAGASPLEGGIPLILNARQRVRR